MFAPGGKPAYPLTPRAGQTGVRHLPEDAGRDQFGYVYKYDLLRNLRDRADPFCAERFSPPKPCTSINAKATDHGRIYGIARKAVSHRVALATVYLALGQ